MSKRIWTCSAGSILFCINGACSAAKSVLKHLKYQYDIKVIIDSWVIYVAIEL